MPRSLGPSPIARAREAERRQSARFTRRVLLLGGAQLAFATVLGARLYKIQVLDSEKYRLLAEQNRVSLRLIAAPRGKILDRQGKILAENTTRFQLVLLPAEVADAEQTLRTLAEILHLPDETLREITDRLKKHPRFLPYVVREELGWREVSAVEVNTPRLAGVYVVTSAARHYPQGEALSHVLGYISKPNEEDQKLYPQIRRVPGVKVGRSGLEIQYEAILQGRPGTKELEVDASGRPVRELSHKPGTPGEDLITTIDDGMQHYTWKRLQSERSAAAVVLDLYRGDVLALASHPSVDPGLFDGKLTDKTWQQLQSDPLKPLNNKVIAGQYAPGSTFKPVVALAALESGHGPHTEFYCPGHFTLGDHRFHCWKKEGHGRLTMRDAMKASCDVYFYQLGLKAGLENIAAVARLLGLGSRTRLGVSGESEGLVPSREWKRSVYNDRWHDGETVVLSIGQGSILTTPLQLAVMSARLATGLEIQPRLVRARLARPHRPVLRELSGLAHGLSLSPWSLAFVRDALDGVVNEIGGTAYRRRIDREGLEMAGKTGTSQVRRISPEEREDGVTKNEDLPWRRRDHALFIGYAPVARPRYAAAVVVEHGGGGSTVAAPIVRDILFHAQSKIERLAGDFNGDGARRG
ncbi:MAG: penicillin-binding protein 2 [Alphaproteobacteria bacterium]|nr:penicillin-binding protein 2 [Alphaproteobacteria bacterium]MDA8004649.1 penicillin-binding protein 2 [Alphaproteobacteria bacterium]MDA8005879.1 penicillin-binding protein 2 [Alphaproteobacteria bacterium]MDA8012885.1 penicillin-binding protein 2 [Alphaproteobacteria bacterium]